MAFDFPASPTVGQQFTPSGGPTWQWDGITWKLAQVAQISDAPSDGITYARKNGLWVPTPQTPYNWIINGDMEIAQRGVVNLAAGGSGYGFDRWYAACV